MYDSIDLTQFPAHPEAVAGYVGGNWPTYNELVAKFPDAHHLSIAVQATQHARCLDIEPGDATNAQAAGWLDSHADRSHGTPVLYTSASNVSALRAAVGSRAYLMWSAHYTHTPHICAPDGCGYPYADATQYTDQANGKNLDASLCSDAFFASSGPQPPTEEDLVSVAACVADNGTMHVFVEAQDGSLWYTYQPKGQSGWNGGVPGKQVAGLSKLAPAPGK
jgi:hypothetical protein